MTESLGIKFEESKTHDSSRTDFNDDDFKVVEHDIQSKLPSKEDNNNLIYNLKENPTFILTIFLSLQVLIVVLFNVIWLPLALSQVLCIHPQDEAKVEIISLSMFSSGISTLIFSSAGLRLPILMLPNTYFIKSMQNILEETQLKCPGLGDLYAMGPASRALEWQGRLKVLQGGILIVSLLQFFIGFTGISGLFDKLLSKPQVLIPATIFIGLSYTNEITSIVTSSSTETDFSIQWSTVVLTAIIILTAALKCQNLEFSLPSCTDRCATKNLKLFRLFPILGASLFVLIIYPFVTTIIYGKNGEEQVSQLLKDNFDDSHSFFLHTPFSYGWPSFQTNSLIFLLPPAIIQIIQSIIVYRVTNSIFDQNIKRKSVNKGMLTEGICSLIASVFGMTTSVSPINIGLMQLTGDGSKWAIPLSGILLIIFSISTSSIEFLVNIAPNFILSTLYVISAIILITGLSLIRKINTNSIHNCIVIGSAIYAAYIIPKNIEHKSSESLIINVIMQIISSDIILCVISASILDILLPKNNKFDVEEDDLRNKNLKRNCEFTPCEECLTICCF